MIASRKVILQRHVRGRLTNGLRQSHLLASQSNQDDNYLIGTRTHHNFNIQQSRLHCFNSFDNHLKFSSKLFSSSSYQYEYPTRTEAPTITRTVASSLKLDDQSVTTTKETAKKQSKQLPSDHFGFADLESPSLSRAETTSILSQQKTLINTSLPSTFAIDSTPPYNVPPNLPQDSLSTPFTQISTLHNGIRVASQETYGQVCTFGVISNCGSRLEHQKHNTIGVNHLMELLAFCGTKNLDSTSYQNALDNLGGVSFASSSREQFLYCIDVLRPNIDKAMYMLQDVILNPNINDQVVEDMKRVIEFQWMDIIPEILVSEGLQKAAYGPSQQLGQSHFCPLEALSNLNAKIVVDFRNKYLLNPHSLVIAAAGIEHEHLVSLAQQYFGHLQSNSKIMTPNELRICNHDNDFHINHSDGIIKSTYNGGSYRQTVTTPDGFTRVALAFPTGGWHSDDLVPACVLQTLLGGGSSFSAGGPGKGMYSRLYRQVLNRYYWAESCEAFTSFHAENGLLGISGSTISHKAGDLTKVLAEHFMKLAIDLVDDEELDRARNMLKCNVLTQLESRLVLFEDVGRQILTYNKREGSQEMCAKIDAVTKEDLRRLARASMIGMKPTLCTVGDDVSNVPSFEDVETWFKLS